MSKALVKHGNPQRARLIRLAVDSVDSQHSKRLYRRALVEFFEWKEEHHPKEFTKAVLNEYRDYLVAEGGAASSINVKLAAIRLLAREAADNGLMDQQQANGLVRAKGVRSEGVRIGNWLSRDEAEALVNAPDHYSLMGLRDRAVLALLIGTAIRREECASLTMDHIQRREGRTMLVDIVGKRNKVRSVPIPLWATQALANWTATALITTGPVWFSFRKGGRIVAPGISPQAIWGIVERHAKPLGFDVTPHDLRRTAAKLMEKAGAPLKQISLILGHESLDVTKRYLGGDLEIENAATDFIDIKLK